LFLRLGDGVYQFGKKQIKVSLEKDGKLFVSTGGGFSPIKGFVDRYAPSEFEKLTSKDLFETYQVMAS